MSNPHRTAFAIGDAGGIAPELSARVLADRDANGDDLIVFGDLRLIRHGAEQAEVPIDLPVIGPDELGGMGVFRRNRRADLQGHLRAVRARGPRIATASVSATPRRCPST